MSNERIFFGLSGKRFSNRIRSVVGNIRNGLCYFVYRGNDLCSQPIGANLFVGSSGLRIIWRDNLCNNSTTKSPTRFRDKNYTGDQGDDREKGAFRKRRNGNFGRIHQKRENRKKKQGMIYLFEYESQSGLLGNRALVDEIKRFDGWVQCFNRTWLIATRDSIEDANRKLQRHFANPQDKSLLVPISQYTGRMPQAVWDWIDSLVRQGY